MRVDDAAHRAIWNELMAREHPCGMGPLVGAQMRYLIGSAHGWLCMGIVPRHLLGSE
nr:hypothetical protein [Ectothiorhodospira sp. BSL-9]